MSITNLNPGKYGSNHYDRDFQTLTRAWRDGVELGSRHFHIQTLQEEIDANLRVLHSELASLRQIDNCNAPEISAFSDAAGAITRELEDLATFATFVKF